MGETKSGSPWLMLVAILVGAAGCLVGARIGGQDYAVAGGGAAVVVCAVAYYTVKGLRGRKPKKSPREEAIEMLKMIPKDDLLDVLLVASYGIGAKNLDEDNAFIGACLAVALRHAGKGDDKERGYGIIAESVLWGQQNKAISVPLIERLDKTLESRYGVSLR